MLQLTSKRFLRELDEAPEGNNLQYILKFPCIPFFGNQGLYNEIVLGGNGGCSGVMCEGSSYIYPSSKVATSRSNGSGIENGIEVCPVDVSWDSWVLPIVLHDVTLLENFLWKCNMEYTLYPWISLLESTLETSYKPQT